MIPLLLVLIVVTVALVCYLVAEIVVLNRELRSYREAEIDDMNARDQWANRYEHEQGQGEAA